MERVDRHILSELLSGARVRLYAARPLVGVFLKRAAVATRSRLEAGPSVQ